MSGNTVNSYIMTDYSYYQHINTKTSGFIYELSLLRVFFRGEDTDYLDLGLEKYERKCKFGILFSIRRPKGAI